MISRVEAQTQRVALRNEVAAGMMFENLMSLTICMFKVGFISFREQKKDEIKSFNLEGFFCN